MSGRGGNWPAHPTKGPGPATPHRHLERVNRDREPAAEDCRAIWSRKPESLLPFDGLIPRLRRIN